MILDMLRQLQKNGRACKVSEWVYVLVSGRVAWIFAARCLFVKSDGWDSWAATILATLSFQGKYP
jgi:hypothetical protein